MTVAWVIRPVHAKAIERAGTDTRDVTVKNLVGVFREFEAIGLAAVLAIEETNLHLRGIGGEDSEVRTMGVVARTERQRFALADTLSVTAHIDAFGWRSGAERAIRMEPVQCRETAKVPSARAASPSLGRSRR